MTTERKQLIAKLRYMGRQYSGGQLARGGAYEKHYLEEAADVIEALLAAQVPEGMRLAPREPNDAMQLAGAQAIRFDTTVLNKMWTANAVWRAMHDAAHQAGEVK